jgi:hypothetical protein
MKKISILVVVAVMAMLMGSCMSTQMTVSRSVPEIQLKPENLDITQQMEATAVTVRVFGIDWERLFSSRSAAIRGSVYTPVPIVDKTDQYAVYSLLKQNEGYDMVLYPQFTTVVRKPFLGLGAIYKVTEVKVTARMAKLKTK